MTTRHYQQAAEAFREIREEFYRTRLQRGQRLDLHEARWLAQRQWNRDLLMMPFPIGSIQAIANLVNTLRELGRRNVRPTPSFPSGGLTTSN